MDGLSNIKNQLLTERIEDAIFQYILAERLPLGTKLPNEYVLANRFGVGRSTIREAVRLLVSKGILQVRRGSGTYLVSTTPISADPLGLQAIEDKMALALDLADLRIMLEPDIAELAAINRTEAELEALRARNDEVTRLIQLRENYLNADIAFHSCVARCSHNTVVEQLIPIIDTAVMMFSNITHEKLLLQTIETHTDILHCIEERDAVGAREAMAMHLTYNRNEIKRQSKSKQSASPHHT